MKIAIIGPESSGKTTIAKLLAKEYYGIFVSEFAREYLENKPSNYKYNIKDLIKIASIQNDLIEKTFLGKVIVADTEMLVIKIWAEDKFGNCPHEIESLLANQKFDYYFLCKPDFPWEFDKLREDSNRRDEIYKIYLAYCNKLKFEFSILEGNITNRLIFAKKTINQLNHL
jgi:nicotinamide riboside kinase